MRVRSVKNMSSEPKIWMDGKLVDESQATTHILSHTLHYGLGAFEGIRAYQTHDGRTALFRLGEHVERLLSSCHAAMISVPYGLDELSSAIVEVVRHNGLHESYVRPVVWLGRGSLKILPVDNPVHVAIAAWSWGAYLGKEALEEGVRCKVSSYTRIGIRSHLEKAKICGQYVNSVLAKREAQLDGYDEALVFDDQGYAAEGTGENIYLVRRGTIYTPPPGAPILDGITRDSVLHLAQDLGFEVREQMITRSELYTATEVFLSGTAAEITPVREIDGRTIGAGKRGPITHKLQEAYFKLVRGESESHPSWLTYV